MDEALDAIEFAASNLALAMAVGGEVKEFLGGREGDYSKHA
jgi:hypothetical protein